MNSESHLGAIAHRFQIGGEFVGANPCGSGHINDTWCAVFRHKGEIGPFILQRVNTSIFKDPAALMEKIQRVTAHIAAQVAGEPDCDRRVLTLIPACDGRAWLVDRNGQWWRAFRFIENARSKDAVESPEQAFQAARAFGRFQKLLAGLPAPRLRETIPDFHNTPKRFKTLEQVIASGQAGRAVMAKSEIEFALARGSLAGVLVNAGLPERVTHNDAKLNNVLLDEVTGEGLCVIDLDTVMPGLALYDFGDMVRTTTSPAREDERDLSRVGMQFPMFEAVVRGYLSSAGCFLTKAEKQHLVVSSKLIAFEQGIRFLTDFLAGDTYFKVHRDAHNLDRCRTQFKLLKSIERQEERMNRLVESIE